MTEDERATTQLWEIKATDGGNVMHKIANKFQWSNGYVWHFNIAINIMEIVDDRSPWYKALCNSLEYNGTQVLQYLPTQAASRLNTLLGNMHPLQQETVRQLPYFGVKTVERLRGNPTVMEFVNTIPTWKNMCRVSTPITPWDRRRQPRRCQHRRMNGTNTRVKHEWNPKTTEMSATWITSTERREVRSKAPINMS